MLPSITFLLTATLLAITPGPGIAYVVARTVAGGRAEGIASCIGTAIGGMAHVLAAALGLSLLLAQSALAYTIVKYLGAAYLIYLGVKILVSRAASTELPTIERAGTSKALRDGVLVEALNVKTAMFFLAFIPQFVSANHALASQFILLGTICVLLNAAVDVLAVLAANRFVASGTAKATRERLLSRVSGATMLSLGLIVAAANRES
ncbi:threonine/homoserine/homoserine lactone efflux protein [Paucimonas lemoignei]|uniref:Threonine/homoserine/homoserine lactone efflux protein n=1 Tax=Paucimonas lemoignei TaxID=29443 RepID=A0A4V2UI50_PAULE|nr:LysE family translocator [Paucimonas lemoignei]TCS33066.1 threonine/homoserine/homoserine lactone efflux protein [Paucimonas lemoignei]